MSAYRLLCAMFVIGAAYALYVGRTDLMAFAFAWAILLMLVEISERVKGKNGN